jgi:hypothetical protein
VDAALAALNAKVIPPLFGNEVEDPLCVRALVGRGDGE